MPVVYELTLAATAVQQGVLEGLVRRAVRGVRTVAHDPGDDLEVRPRGEHLRRHVHRNAVLVPAALLHGSPQDLECLTRQSWRAASLGHGTVDGDLIEVSIPCSCEHERYCGHVTTSV